MATWQGLMGYAIQDVSLRFPKSTMHSMVHEKEKGQENDKPKENKRLEPRFTAPHLTEAITTFIVPWNISHNCPESEPHPNFSSQLLLSEITYALP
jgi:hypothetical protein